MKTIWLATILSTYAVACELPALGSDWDRAETGSGLLTCLPWVLLNPFWYANPIFFAGCVVLALGDHRLASRLGLVASSLAIGFACLIQFEGLQAGFLFWSASMVGLAMSGLVRRHDRGTMGRSAALAGL